MATAPTAGTTTGIGNLPWLEGIVPGISANTNTASQNVGSMLNGLPSAGPARTKAAYFGATSGLPNSGVSSALGYDLYNQDAQRYQQQGFDDLMKMLTTYSGPALQDKQFNTNMAFQSSQANAANRRADAELAMKQQDQEAKYAPRREYGGWIGDNGEFTTNAPATLGAYTNASGFDWMKDPVTGRTTKNNATAWPW